MSWEKLTSACKLRINHARHPPLILGGRNENSVNCMEHANPVEKYLSEALRVVKPGGLIFLRWYPLWFSARGHHVHEDVVAAFRAEYAKAEPWCEKVSATRPEG